MSDAEANRQVIRDLVQAVWREGDLDALPRFWTEDCVNHAAPPPGSWGLAALRAYHAAFAGAFAAFADLEVEVVQQAADGDRVATHLLTRGVHAGEFAGVPATGRRVALATMRMDRLRGGRIAEHWSVSDVAGLVEQLRA